MAQKELSLVVPAPLRGTPPDTLLALNIVSSNEDCIQEASNHPLLIFISSTFEFHGAVARQDLPPKGRQARDRDYEHEEEGRSFWSERGS